MFLLSTTTSANSHLCTCVQLDLNNCLSLKRVRLSYIYKLQILLVPSIRVASKLQSFDVDSCLQLVDI